MAGRNMAANLGMNIDWRLKDPGMFNRGIENFSRPDADPTNMEQMQGLLNWQQQMGREDAARTTMAQVEKLKAEQTTASNLDAERKTSQIRNNMDRIARDPKMSKEQKQIALNGLQAQLSTLSTTEEQVRANSGYGLKTLNAAEGEQFQRNQEARAAENIEMQKARAEAERTERERVANEQAALNQLSTMDSSEWEAHIRANPDHAAVLTAQTSVMREREYRDAQASEYFNRMSEGPDEGWIEENFDKEELDEKGANLLKAVNATKDKYKNGTWTTEEARTSHMKAVSALNDHINNVAQAEADRVRSIDNAILAERVELESRINRPEIGAIQSVLSERYTPEEFNDLSPEEQNKAFASATQRASILVNRDAYMGLANLRISQDPTKTKADDLPEGRTLREFDDFRRARIASNRGLEPGGEAETLAQYKARLKKAEDEERKAADAEKRRTLDLSDSVVKEAFFGSGPTPRKPHNGFDYSNIVDTDNASMRIERINLAPRDMGIYENSFITQALRPPK